MYDLHVHSTVSDGLLSPEEVVEAAFQSDLKGFSLTDHDTLGGIKLARDYLAERKWPLVFVPGIELNTDFQESETHILGYFIHYEDEKLGKRLRQIWSARYERAMKMVERLRIMGLNISFEQVQRIARGDLIGRPHIAKALLEKGYVFSIKEAFQKYIGRGKPAYVPRYKFTPEEAIALIKDAGGVSVLAHPGLVREQDAIPQIIEMGIEGIEVYYPEHSEEQIAEYIALARRKGLLITGGSDFHGIGSGESRGRLGCAGISQAEFDELIAYRCKTKT